MFAIHVWCNDEKRKSIIHNCISFDEYTWKEDTNMKDVLLVDIDDGVHTIASITSKIMNHENCILILLAKDTTSLLDVVGLYVYQYIIYEQLEMKLPKCLHDIYHYLLNISTLSIRTKQGLQYITLKNIEYFRYEDSFVYVSYQNQEFPTQYTSLEKVRSLLGDDFAYCNRTTLLHIPFISSIREHDVILGKCIFSLTRRRKASLQKMCKNRRCQG